MALGAPASLVDRTLTAAREEVQHARMAFALARAISDPFKVSALKLDGVVIEAPNLTEFIEQTIAEACVAETVAVLRAAAALHFAEDKEVRAFLRVIIEEEQRHAKLAWSTLAWALLNAGMDQTARNAARNAIASEIDKLQVRKQEEAQEDVVTAKLLRLGILSRDLDMTAVGDAVILVERLGVELSSLSKTSSLEDFDQVVSGLFEISLKSDKVWTQSGHVATEVWNWENAWVFHSCDRGVFNVGTQTFQAETVILGEWFRAILRHFPKEPSTKPSPNRMWLLE